MNNRLLAKLLKPRHMPPPDPQCRVLDYAQTVVLFRNHERSVQQSRECGSSSALGPGVAVQGVSFEPAGTDPSYFQQHTYEQLSRGF